MVPGTRCVVARLEELLVRSMNQSILIMILTKGRNDETRAFREDSAVQIRDDAAQHCPAKQRCLELELLQRARVLQHALGQKGVS